MGFLFNITSPSISRSYTTAIMLCLKRFRWGIHIYIRKLCDSKCSLSPYVELIKILRLNQCVCAYCLHGNTPDKQRTTREKKFVYVLCLFSLLNACLAHRWVCGCTSEWYVFLLMPSFPFQILRIQRNKQANKFSHCQTCFHTFSK